MNRIVKVFCTGRDQDRLAESYAILERYQAFVLAEVSEEKLKDLSRSYPVEDITELYTLRVGESIIDTTRERVDAKGKLRAHPAYRGIKRLLPGRHHHLVQFIGPVKEEWLKKIEKLGAKPRSPHQALTYIVKADNKALEKIIALPFVRWVGHLSHRDRIASSVLERIGRKIDDVTGGLPRTRVIPGTYIVEFFDAADMTSALPDIAKLGFDVLDEDTNAKVVVLHDPKGGSGAAKRIHDLSAVHGVRFIRERSLKRTANNVAAEIMGTSVALGQSGLGLSGEGEVIGVCDTGLDSGDPQSIHQDFAGRVAWIKSYPITADYRSYIKNPGGDDGAADFDSGHGTHVAGSVLGDGRGSAGLAGVEKPIRGLAHGAKLVFQAVEQEMKWKNPNYYKLYGRYLLSGIPLDLATLFSDAYARKARIHSNSWGGGEPGAYDSQCEQLDRFVWEHKDFCVLVASGNDGTDNDGDGRINPMSVSSPATAKNCITVGACENDRPNFNAETYGRWWPNDYPVAPFRNDPMADNPGQVVAFSSRGPTRDDRIKPDVVAPGTFVLSTRSTMLAPNNMAWAAFPPSRLYFHMGGTSMATPLTAGATALIREYLRKERGITNPSAALIKAALVAGAQRLAGYGKPGAVCDNDQGYGRVHLDAILAPTAPAQAVFMDVKPGLQTGELYAEDITIQSSRAFLRVALAYSDYPGSSLVNNLNLILVAPDGSRHVGNQGGDGQLGLDAKNNVEVAWIASPMAGTWRVEVVGSNIPRGPQDFALVCLGHIGEDAPPADIIRADASPSLDIPDNSDSGVTSVIAIHQEGLVRSIKVGVDIAHPYIGDLRVAVSPPDGTSVVLHDRHGASADDIVKTYDIHSTPDLAKIGGKPVRGEWRLAVSDHARYDVGQLRRWNLEIGLEPTNKIEQEVVASLAIPDNDPAGIVSTMNITQSGPIGDIRVSVDITHTWIGDLSVTLVAPSGDAVSLHSRGGGSQDNIIRTFGANDLPALQGLAGKSVTGTWALKVADHAGRDVGKLNRWGLEILIG